jgi:hypothetical protein
LLHCGFGNQPLQYAPTRLQNTGSKFLHASPVAQFVIFRQTDLSQNLQLLVCLAAGRLVHALIVEDVLQPINECIPSRPGMWRAAEVAKVRRRISSRDQMATVNCPPNPLPTRIAACEYRCSAFCAELVHRPFPRVLCNHVSTSTNGCVSESDFGHCGIVAPQRGRAAVIPRPVASKW